MQNAIIEGHQVLAGQGAVSAQYPTAARIGAHILAQGGNAMDAASATSLACCMLAPQSNGIGGYMSAAVVLEGLSDRVWSLDANAIAPAAANEQMYDILPVRQGDKDINEKEYACSVRDDANVYGPQSVAAPGQMAGMGLLHERWGQLPWAQIVAPSQKLLADGFPYGANLANTIRSKEPILRRFPETLKHLAPAGQLPGPDDIWHRPDMEKPLARLAQAGWRDFYDGELGRTIGDCIEAAGGALNRQDMATFEPRLTHPYQITYRDVPVYGPILPNGCLSALQILHMLEGLPVVPDDQAQYWHQLAEVVKRAWRDRLRWVGDPDFVEVPIERLLSKEYAAGRIQDILHFPEQVDSQVFEASGPAVAETLHVSAADSQGNLVGITITQGSAFGSCFTVPGTGIILGHGMCRLDPRPGKANSVAAHKRPLNNVVPMLLRLPQRDVAIGLPGGRRIISVGAQLGQRIVDFNATSLGAATAPRLNAEAQEPLELTRGISPDIVRQLEAMGHRVTLMDAVAGGAHGAEVLKSEGKVRAGGNGWAAGIN
ncbi:MAG: hypothetical protein GKR89_25185 [Candidatus Latescibacteria bacterium]|nr:hypothetical protein [Candidatus Latescibacterota bacterium]